MNLKNSSAEYNNQELFMKKPLVVVVLGPTASGKTSLGIEIAEKFGGGGHLLASGISAISREDIKNVIKLLKDA